MPGNKKCDFYVLCELTRTDWFPILVEKSATCQTQNVLKKKVFPISCIFFSFSFSFLLIHYYNMTVQTGDRLKALRALYEENQVDAL